MLAFTADSVNGVAGHVMVALTSSGFAWGLAAVLAGRHADTVRRAVAGATGLLVLATVLYYLLILLVSRRWSGATLADGSSADMAGLRSVAIMPVVWLVAAHRLGRAWPALLAATVAAATAGTLVVCLGADPVCLNCGARTGAPGAGRRKIGSDDGAGCGRGSSGVRTTVTP
ncbi:hypothetical protein [Rhizomonospora bruguierae]|uniref:hypothetical protein n=1 Tax=Rhizomonospora bruguierae TaxID=1581705 RepID=UPI001BCD1A50|nr:hypothetical protein [Micromonospora sp. NBRC 107566]